MKIITNCLVALMALEHIGFLILEMFYWNKPLGLKIFKTDQEFADKSKTLAANQGLYNGFLAAGLIWSIVISEPAQIISTQIFFLCCIFIAGLYGAYSVGKNILFLQAIPAALILALIVYLK